MLKRLLPALFLTLPLVVLFPFLNQFALPINSKYSDLLISHLPNAIFLRHALVTWKTIPFWSNTILSGYPFAADPLAGLWYPPGWLGVILPAPYGFNTAILLHLFWAGFGTYLFLRGRKLSMVAGLFGAITFEITPKLLAHFAAGHITLVYAVSWTPWLLLAEDKQSKGISLFHRIAPGVVLGLICLADVRWAIIAGLFWLAYRLSQRREWLRENENKGKGNTHWIINTLVQLIFGILLASPLLLPLIEFVNLSGRQHLSSTESSVYALPIARVLGLIFPDPGNLAEWMIYPGGVAFLLFILAIVMRDWRRKTVFWWSALPVIILFSFGIFAPLTGLIPGLNMLRVPPRAMFLSAFCFAVLSGYGIEQLLGNQKLTDEKQKRDGVLALVFWLMSTLILTISVFLLTGIPSPQFIFGALSISIAAVLIIFRLKNRIQPAWFIIPIFLLLFFDLWGVDIQMFRFAPKSQIAGEASQTAEFLKGQTGTFRTYSPSYSLPQQVAAVNNLELADGIDPMRLEAYDAYMGKASGVKPNGYSVTLPAFVSGNPDTDNMNSLPDPVLLGRLNVRFILSAFELKVAELKEVVHLENVTVYENLAWMPRAWVQPGRNIVSEKIQDATIELYSPNKILISASGPGYLILSENFYPGWLAYVDGIKTPMVQIGEILRGVQLPPGVHHIQFVFQPLSVYLGLLLGFIFWGGIFWLYWRHRSIA